MNFLIQNRKILNIQCQKIGLKKKQLLNLTLSHNFHKLFLEDKHFKGIFTKGSFNSMQSEYYVVKR